MKKQATILIILITVVFSCNQTKSKKHLNETGYFGSICASDFGFIVPGISVQTVPLLPVW
ncbi:hypothetical protein A9996_19100 [Gelidibacter algens]|nr:hypothetical protein A9996_19100 [Gelidibacter algens]